MNLRIVASVAALALLAAAGWAWQERGSDRKLLAADPDAIAADVARTAMPAGKAAYGAHCAGCHGADGKGDFGQGIPSLADADWLYGGKVSEIEQTVTFGIRASNGRSRNLAIMPAYATPRPSPTEPIPPLAPGEINDLVDYVLMLEGRPHAQEAAARGAALFQDKAGCFDCHGADAKGDPAIGAPDLTDRIWLKGDGSRDAIFDSVARGSAGMCPAWTGRLDARAIRAIAIYVHSLSHPG